MKAYKQVKKNKGALGIDGMTVSELKRYLDENLAIIREQMRSRRYKPSPIRRVEIPRNLGVSKFIEIKSQYDKKIR